MAMSNCNSTHYCHYQVACTVSRSCLTQLELKLKLATLVGQGKDIQPLHVPKMVEICLKVGPRLFWIDFQVPSQT